MTHRYITTFVYTARVPIEAEDRYIDNLTFDHIDIEEE